MNSQFLRYSHICTFANDFIFNCNLFCQKLFKNGYTKSNIKKLIRLFYNKHKSIFIKYNINDLSNIFQFSIFKGRLVCRPRNSTKVKAARRTRRLTA